MQNRAITLLSLTIVLIFVLSCSQSANHNRLIVENSSNTNLTEKTQNFNFNTLPTVPCSGEKLISEIDFTKINGPWIEQSSTQTVFTNSNNIELDTTSNTQTLTLQSTSIGKRFTTIFAVYGLGGIFDASISKPVSVTVFLSALNIPLANTGYNIGIADYNSLAEPSKRYSPWQWITNIEDKTFTVKFDSLFSDKEKKVPINPISPNGSIYIAVLASSKVTAKVQKIVWNFDQLDGRYNDGSRNGPFVVTLVERNLTDLPQTRIYYPYPNTSEPFFDPINGIYSPAGQCPVVVLLPQRDVPFSNLDQYYKDLVYRLVSWGFIVVCPNYVDTQVAPKKFSEIFKYIDTCFAYMQSENAKSSSPFIGKVLTNRRLVVGIGYGGGAALSYAATTTDSNVQTAVAIAPIDSNISGDQKFADSLIGPKLNRNVVIISGELDNIAKKSEVQKLFELAGSETSITKIWFEIKGGNHQQLYTNNVPLLGDNTKPTINRADQLKILNRYTIASLQAALGVNYQIPLLPETKPKFYGKIAEIWTTGAAGANDKYINRTIKP